MREQLCNVVMLPTTKEQFFTAPIYRPNKVDQVSKDELVLRGTGSYSEFHYTPQHVYVTNPNEPIKEGDWFIANQGVHQCIEDRSNNPTIMEQEYPYGIDNAYHKDKQRQYMSKHWNTKIIACSDPKLVRITNGIINKLFNAVDGLSLAFMQAYIREHNEGHPITQCKVEYKNIGDVYHTETSVTRDMHVPNTRKDGTIITHPAPVQIFSETHMLAFANWTRRIGDERVIEANHLRDWILISNK